MADFGYGKNGVGNVTQIAELSQTRDFAYDDLQRLTAGGTTAVPESYSYDEEGNRTASHLSAAHTTDTANRLTEDDQFTYVYDANGNLTSKTDKATLATTGDTVIAEYDGLDLAERELSRRRRTWTYSRLPGTPASLFVGFSHPPAPSGSGRP